jgi:hypothetical protein
VSWLSTAVVLCWALAYFAWAGASADPGDGLTASVEPVVHAPPPVLPEPPQPEPLAQSAPAPQPGPEAPQPVGEQGLSLGRALLASGGAFPALNASYERFGSFREYARSMQRLGARFVVVSDRRIVGSADIETARVAAFEDEVGSAASFSPARFSPIPRDYSSEPALRETAQAARRLHGSGARVQMLLPRALDAGLFGGIAQLLATRGEEPRSYTEIRGFYEPAAGGDVWFRIESGTQSSGRSVALSRSFDLSALARHGEAG